MKQTSPHRNRVRSRVLSLTVVLILRKTAINLKIVLMVQKREPYIVASSLVNSPARTA